MEEKEMLKVYYAPKAKMVDMGIINILCGSVETPDEDEGASTERLNEKNVFGSIW